ncbi:MAG: hypothetical protein WC248_07100 [Candidatus Methanomethylophilaceae archaeon]|jgi:sugar phosphate isomerase/epimerase
MTKHLICHSVYTPIEEVAGNPIQGLDGVELLTGYEPVDASFLDLSTSVHLPYATDWYAAWTGVRKVSDDIPDEDVRYLFYGREKKDIINNLKLAMDNATVVDPAYAVLHACNANLDEILAYDYSDDDEKILSVFIEMVNEVISLFPNGEPPFKILFENLWWPGLKMLDDKGFRLIEKKIEFENWGLCLDTGHLMVSTKRSREEKSSIQILERIFENYPKEMIDRIITMHLHQNTSADFMKTYSRDPNYLRLGTIDRLNVAYGYIFKMDEHRPFTLKEATHLVDIIKPKYVTHEMGAVDILARIRDFKQQRALFQK